MHRMVGSVAVNLARHSRVPVMMSSVTVPRGIAVDHPVVQGRVSRVAPV